MIGGRKERGGRRGGGGEEAPVSLSSSASSSAASSARVAAAVVMVLMMMCAVGKADEMARIRQKQGLATTSSTLRWVGAEAGQPLPIDALEVNYDDQEEEDEEEEESEGVWCRFTDHGSVAGVVRDGICQAPYMETVVKSDKYEVLVSINGSARIVEKEWSKALWMSDGGVTVDKNRVLALTRTPDGLVLPGYADVKERQILLLNGTEVESLDVALILTEEEPEEYAMDGITWDESRGGLEEEDRVLANLTLENTEDELKTVSSQVDYTVTESLYFGNVRGTLKGLRATVTGPGGNVWKVTWGANNDLKSVGDQTISLQIPGKTVVDVNLVGVIHKFKSTYSAKLTAIYADGVRRSRNITAPHEHTYLAEVRADFSRPRSLTTGQELPGEFPTSEILVASTTTTSTTTTTTPSHGAATGEDEKTGSLATPGTSFALPTLPTLPATLLISCLVLLLLMMHDTRP